MKYKIRIIDHLRCGLNAIIALLSVPIFYYFDSAINISFKSFETIYLIIIAIGALPSLILHSVYYYINGGNILEINKENQELILDNSENRIVKFNEIIGIEKYTQFEGRPLPHMNYFYYKLLLLNGEYVILTSLLVRNLVLPNKKIEVINSYFPMP